MNKQTQQEQINNTWDKWGTWRVTDRETLSSSLDPSDMHYEEDYDNFDYYELDSDIQNPSRERGEIQTRIPTPLKALGKLTKPLYRIANYPNRNEQY